MHSGRLLLALTGLSVLSLLGLLALQNISVARAWYTPEAWYYARADSDSTVVTTDSSRTDSTAADSTISYTLVPRYMVIHRDTIPIASLFPRKKRPFLPPLGRFWKHEIRMDSSGHYYIARELVGKEEVRAPLMVDFTTYVQEHLAHSIEENWHMLALRRTRQRQQRRGGLGFSIVIPGGRQSAFTTIFGKPEVDLRVNGQANIDAGFAYQKNDQQVSVTGRSGRLDPDFGQEIRLGITGTIGDKLRVNVNWDTERMFDYQNQLKLEYTGYEDEIIQRITAGNVFLQTPSTLINGGQTLFGIKSEFQLGGLHLTTVMSQQEGESNELTLEGGSQTTEFDLKPTDYEDNVHFFLGYFFRQSWEPALSQPPTLLIRFDRITDVEVWKLQQTETITENTRMAVGVLDLGEPPVVLQGADAYAAAYGDDPPLPHPDIDQYTEADLAILRDGNQPVDDLLKIQKGLTASDYVEGKFQRLQPGRDFEFDNRLGFISLRTPLTEGEAIAVAFRYIGPDGRSVQVGDIPNAGGSEGNQLSDRIVLKLIRPQNIQPSVAAWDLTMRNVYQIRSRNIDPNTFELQIFYERPGQPASTTLPGVTVGQQQTLLQILGLDRLNENGSPIPDNKLDFEPYIIDPATGRLYFPYLEPFGKRIDQIIQDPKTRVSADRNQLRDLYVFSDLYRKKQIEARRNSQHDVYRIRGSYKSAVREVYDLGFGIVEGSVRVTSGGVELNPGSDYVVDYATGTLTITNPSFLTPGRDIKISYERNQLASIQKKTLLGLRADYEISPSIKLGATAMHLAEKPLMDKFRINEEPISNTIWGIDGSIQSRPRMLTRLLDALPLIQTKEPSSINISGEFAQLRPGHPTTLAFERTQRSLRSQGANFKPDELRGISYIDDFEGIKNTFSLRQPGAWRLSAPIAEIPDHPVSQITRSEITRDSLYTNWRALTGWYVLPLTLNFTVRADNTEAVRPIHINEVYPNRDVSAETNKVLQTFDFYFDPTQRGPYNYTRDLQSFKEHPEWTWGGITQRIPEGYTDFNLNNIEFIEFIFSPISRAPGGDAGPDARLFIDLGLISEDILPNRRLNTEDGLAFRSESEIAQAPRDSWGRLSSSIQNTVVDVDQGSERTEDLGLDGLASHNSEAYGSLSEQSYFADFLEAVRQQFGENSPEYRRALLDPSADDYHYYRDEGFFGNPELFPEPPLLQERFSHFFPGQELNSFEAQRRLRGGVGNSKIPDTEDLNLNATLDAENSYYEYEIPLSKAKLDELADPRNSDDFIVTKIKNDANFQNASEWYMVRIPVKEFTRRYGNIDGFSLIQAIRIWTTGHRAPITIRFASFDLVGSQWQKSQQIGQLGTPTEFTVATINTDENPEYIPPRGTIRTQIRLSTGGIQEGREQAMLLRVKELMPGDERAVFKTLNQRLDFLKYERLRMFFHAHGYDRREDLRVFVRLGINETNDYYEYEQPLTPSDPLSGDPDVVWQTNQKVGDKIIDMNALNLELKRLNQLKVSRDEAVLNGQARLDSVYSRPLNQPDAPPDARISIKGNPSLSGITTLTIGIRNPETGEVLHDVTVWANELRVTGFDQRAGWAAIGKAQIKLADVAQINANLRMQTSGFGDLSSKLGDRQQVNLSNWALTTQFNAHKLLPERYGWSIPITYAIRTNVSTPEFDPNRGDIRLSEILAEIEENDSLDAATKAARKQEVLESAQTFQSTQSISIPISKRGSRSPILRYTLDLLGLTYSYSQAQARNPSQQLNRTWQWSTSLNYRLAVRRPRTIRILGFLDGVPILHVLSGLHLNYLPQSLSFSATTQRNFAQNRERPRRTLQQLNNLQSDLPEIIQYPFRENHTMGHRRNFNIQYNPFTFFRFSYDASVNQSLRSASVDTVYNVAFGDTVLAGMTLNQAIQQGIVDSAQVNAFEFTRLRPVPLTDIIRRLVTGKDSIRTEDYQQNFTFTFAPQINRIRALNWITIRPITYRAQFRWQNGPVYTRPEDNLGASIATQSEVSSELRLQIQELWRKFKFYRDLEKADRETKRPARPAPSDTTRKARKGIRIPLPRPLTLLRKLFLTATSIRDFSVSYSHKANVRSSNVRGGYSLFDAFSGDAPSLAYRLGLASRLDTTWRIINARLQVSDQIQTSNQVRGQTSITPGQSLRISMNFEAGWNNGESISYRRVDGRIQQSRTRSGNTQVSVWTFGGSYDRMLARQFATFMADVNRLPENAPVISDANGDNRVVLTSETLVEDFTQAFIKTIGIMDKRGFLPFPMPGWNITYSGLSHWPLLKSLTTAVSISHQYLSTYTVDYRTNIAAGLDPDGNPYTQTFPLGSRLVEYIIPEIEANAVRLNERYQPLIGANITWKGGIQSTLNWQKSRSLTLNPGNAEVAISKTEELSGQLSFSKRGLTLPFLGSKRRLNNTIRFSLVISRSTNEERRYYLAKDLKSLLDGNLPEPPSPIATTRINIQPRLGYQLSNRVTADFFVTYEHLESEGSRVPSTTNINGGFNIRVNISN